MSLNPNRKAVFDYSKDGDPIILLYRKVPTRKYSLLWLIGVTQRWELAYRLWGGENHLQNSRFATQFVYEDQQ